MKRLILGAAAMLFSVPAFAQKAMYRCGNNYQDRPCDGGTPAARSATAVPATPVNAVAPAVSAAKATTAPVADGQKVAAPLAKAQQQQQIRCENFSRQRDELRERQRASPQQAAAVGVQIKSLESRMSADNCS